MPNLMEYKRYLQKESSNTGQVRKTNSDIIMEHTWQRDIQSKKCYIYDYFHDDQYWLASGMTYSNTLKTSIDAKFIISRYQSLDKDQSEYHLQFRPSQKLEFNENDELHYYETDFRQKYHADFPIGLYIDIPDDRGVYKKWLICGIEIANQFPKYIILPCNYYFHYIDVVGNKRIIRKIWGVTRSQNSYNSGLWSDNISTSVENQFKALLPMNKITERIYYTDELDKNQRIVISANTFRPIVWQVSKVEHMVCGRFGLQRLTFMQTQWNDERDYKDENAINPDGTPDVFAMYADYNDSTVPVESSLAINPRCEINTSTYVIKAGGGYKTLTAVFYDINGVDITEQYVSQISTANWCFLIDDEDITNSEIISVIGQEQSNKIKLKFNKDLSYINKVLTIKCVVDSIVGIIQLEILSL